MNIGLFFFILAVITLCLFIGGLTYFLFQYVGWLRYIKKHNQPTTNHAS